MQFLLRKSFIWEEDVVPTAIANDLWMPTAQVVSNKLTGLKTSVRAPKNNIYVKIMNGVG